MGVYIKGMDEIPEDGAVLVVMHGNRKTYIKHACTYGYSMEMVEVPEPHGRLIDADALADKWIWGNTDRTRQVECIELHDLEDSPTVIEAEGE